ncbi:MAG: AAA family ATPase [bacterium]|nr:AAA family ATPase [bacterium]
MLLKSITIKNFRCYDNEGIVVDFCDSESVASIIGRNGSGKTSILDAINFLFGQDYLPTKICERDFHCDASGIKDKIVIEGETVNPFFTSIDVISEKQISHTILVPCNKVRLTIKRREKQEKILDDAYTINKEVIPLTGIIGQEIYASLKSKAYEVSSIEKIDGVDDIEELKKLVKECCLGNATKVDFDNTGGGFYSVNFKLKNGGERSADFPAFSLSFNLSRLKNFPKVYYLTKNRDKDVSGDYSFVSKILGDLHWKWKRQSEKKTNFSDIAEKYETLAQNLRGIVDEKSTLIKTVNRIIKDVCSVDIEAQIDFIDLEQPYKSAFIAKKEQNKLLLPENLGSGFNIIVSYALFNYVASLEKVPIILLIDEPELHLHVDWQLKMYNIFSEQKNLHIIYSTQSENFISLRNWKQIKLVQKRKIYPEKDKLLQKEVATNGNEYRMEEYLDSYAKRCLDVSLILRGNLEIFFTEKIIIVEGPGDKYALPKLLNLIGCNVDKYSVSIIPVWGKSKLKVYQMICKAFDLNYFTIFDGDAGASHTDSNNNEKENNALKLGSQDEKYVMFSTSLEKLLGVSGLSGDTKFQRLIKIIDELKSIDGLNSEVVDAITKIKAYMEMA